MVNKITKIDLSVILDTDSDSTFSSEFSFFVNADPTLLSLNNSGALTLSPAGQVRLVAPDSATDITGTGLNDAITSGNGGATIHAGQGNDTVVGGNGRDLIYGEDGNDTLQGGRGADLIDGGAGNDIILGGQGGDLLTGGTGANVFVYATNSPLSVTDSPFTATSGLVVAYSGSGDWTGPWDVITDFQPGVDKIDLHALPLSGMGPAKLVWLGAQGTDASAANPNPALAHGVWYATDGSGVTYLYADIHGDGTADLKIQLNAVPLAGDIIVGTGGSNFAGTSGATAAPVLNANGGSLSYTENQAATAIDALLTASDSKSTTLAGATVSITGNFNPAEDALAFTTQNGITGSYNFASGVLTLSGTASVADYQSALRSVTYANSSDNPSGTTRIISYQVDDGAGTNHASNVVTAAVSVTPVNDPAVIAGTTGGTVIEAGAGTAGTPTMTATLTDSDVDNVSNSFQAVSSPTVSSGGYGTYTMTAGGTWSYTLNNSSAAVQGLNASQTLSDTFTVQTVDGTAQVVNITINGTNDAAIISGTASWLGG